jgi:hypothetical protein
MAESTPRLALPMLAPGQAQKEVTHNEALVLLDALIAATVEAANAVTPPAQALPGQCWALGNAPTGAWAGQGGALAIATAGGWRFCPVPDNFAVRVAQSGALWQRSGSGWTPPAVIGDPAGGAVIDAEARGAITALLNALAGQGLISVN